MSSNHTVSQSTSEENDLPVIEVKNLVKEYRLGALEGLRSLGRRLLGRSTPTRKRFRALDDVSFSVRHGEVVGIIGHNGAGKSTLLKHLCGITTPTSGSVTIRGKVAPLIEVGAGLVGEMTGRENIYLNGTILGLTRKEIASKVDDIIAFAELEDFIDTPVKRYSSGMLVRLGFSIATSVECDLLLVDEVLAVGDISFQQKCIDRIAQYIQGRDRTVLIVGHNIRQLERVCDRLIMLEHGHLLIDGNVSEVASRYFSDAQNQVSESHKSAFKGLTPQEAVSFFRVLSIKVGAGANAGPSTLTMHSPMEVRIIFHVDRELTQPEFVVGLHTLDFFQILSVGNADDSGRPNFQPGSHEVRILIRDVPLRPGIYGLRLAIFNEFRQVIWNAANIQPVKIVEGAVEEALLPGMGLVVVPALWDYAANRSNPSDQADSAKL
ncbi:MAG: polysaccharide ABC transporter ATP-binding protein [Gammaproteobacteria bacterium]|jgi:ABC-type polysaccharide/polyol phosphate transport system ATPase subunit